MPSLTESAISAPATRQATVWLLAALLGGCAGWPPGPVASVPPPVVVAPAPEPVPPPPPPPPQPPAQPAQPDPAALADAAARRLLAFSDRLRELTPAEIAREQVRLGETPDDPAAQLELALLLGGSRSNGDLPRALVILEPLARPGAKAPWQSLARLLQSRLAEQRRLEEQLERQGQQLREQQRRLEQLGSQLEALKAIERSLSARPPAPAGSAAGKTTP
jgi:hypothetical protein